MCPRSRYDALMNELCVGLGWCGGTVNGEPRHLKDYIPDHGPVTAEQFVDWLLEAEGLDDASVYPERYRKWHCELTEVFIRHMGASTVDATELRSGTGAP